VPESFDFSDFGEKPVSPNIKAEAFVDFSARNPTDLIAVLKHDRLDSVFGQFVAAVRPAGPAPIIATRNVDVTPES